MDSEWHPGTVILTRATCKQATAEAISLIARPSIAAAGTRRHAHRIVRSHRLVHERVSVHPRRLSRSLFVALHHWLTCSTTENLLAITRALKSTESNERERERESSG